MGWYQWQDGSEWDQGHSGRRKLWSWWVRWRGITWVSMGMMRGKTMNGDVEEGPEASNRTTRQAVRSTDRAGCAARWHEGSVLSVASVCCGALPLEPRTQGSASFFPFSTHLFRPNFGLPFFVILDLSTAPQRGLHFRLLLLAFDSAGRAEEQHRHVRV